MVQNTVDEHKFCFIICSNNDFFLQECMFYINQLIIPKGYKVEVISIPDAPSMTAGYNEGMRATDAKYKIYMHQDVFILYPGFLNAVLSIFQEDENIGMIGMVGAIKMPVNGIMWYSGRVGTQYFKSRHSAKDIHSYQYTLEDGWEMVEAIDGLMMITSKDIPWREDLFDAYHYYDISQSIEFLRQGYKIVVPIQEMPWFYHDSPIMNLRNYDHYRKIGLEEYKEIFHPERYTVFKRERKSNSKKDILILIIATNQYDEVAETLQSIDSNTEIPKEQVVIVDNGSEDKLRHWLTNQQDYSFIRCNEIIESYGEIIRQVRHEFITTENVLLISPGIKIQKDKLSILDKAMETYRNCGVISASLESDLEQSKKLKRKKNYSEKQVCRRTMHIPFHVCLIANQLIRSIQIEAYNSPEAFFTDLAFSGILNDFNYYQLDEPLFSCKNPDYFNQPSYYKTRFGNEHDSALLKKKWLLTYFNTNPNMGLIDMIKEPENEPLNILEVGCDCGANLLGIKNKWPNSNLYGVEINPNAVVIAKKIANVEIGNIEEKNLDFGEIKFDYILFEDVLEYLKDPESTIVYCKELLKRNGKFIICVSNLNHYSVMKQLINGHFTYTEMGPLDKTHLHFFTYYEILKMLQRADCVVENISYSGGEQAASREDKEFVNKLMGIAQGTKRFMYFAFQYLLLVSKGE